MFASSISTTRRTLPALSIAAATQQYRVRLDFSAAQRSGMCSTPPESVELSAEDRAVEKSRRGLVCCRDNGSEAVKRVAIVSRYPLRTSGVAAWLAVVMTSRIPRPLLVRHILAAD